MESAAARKYGSPARRPAARSRPRRRRRMKRGKILPACGAALALLLGACSLAPPLRVPDVPTADAYKEMGQWTQAQPADRLPRDSCSALSANTELDAFATRPLSSNPTLPAPPATSA